MSDGISAIKGFDYQAVVILDRLFQHFDQHGAAAQVRPVGLPVLAILGSSSTASNGEIRINATGPRVSPSFLAGCGTHLVRTVGQKRAASPSEFDHLEHHLSASLPRSSGISC